MWRQHNKRRNGALVGSLAHTPSALRALSVITPAVSTQVKRMRSEIKQDDARALLQAHNAPRYLYLLGGQSHHHVRLPVERYSTELQTWEVVCPMKIQRKVYAVVMLQQELYIISGVCTQSTRVDCFDPSTLQWRDVAPLNNGRINCTAVTLDGHLYVLGGETRPYNVMSLVEYYNPDIAHWRDAPSMSIGRTSFAAGVLNGQLYVVGGLSSRIVYLSSVERFDPQAQTWTSVSPLNTARCDHCLAVLEGKLYAIGGTHGKTGELLTETLNSVECYDLLENKWTFVAPMSRPRAMHGVAVLEGKIYAAGGVDGSTKLGTVECYDPHTNEWKPVSKLMSPRFSGALVAV